MSFLKSFFNPPKPPIITHEPPATRDRFLGMPTFTKMTAHYDPKAGGVCQVTLPFSLNPDDLKRIQHLNKWTKPLEAQKISKLPGLDENRVCVREEMPAGFGMSVTVKISYPKNPPIGDTIQVIAECTKHEGDYLTPDNHKPLTQDDARNLGHVIHSCGLFGPTIGSFLPEMIKRAEGEKKSVSVRQVGGATVHRR